MERKTPLYETHIRLGGKMVAFAGYLLPIQYAGGVIAEHKAVRSACGLFDVSHMGEFILKGPDALFHLNYLLTNDFSGMADGQARYSPMCNEQGGVVDDLIVYKEKDERYLLVVNAANRQKDYEWIKAHMTKTAELEDISEQVAQIAVQGQFAEAVLKKLAKEEDIPSKNYFACFDGKVAGIPCIISKTGYTGSDGYELYMAAEDAESVWNQLLEAGKEYGILPCGLGARDTLRLEAAMPLYGHEMSETITPYEAKLGMFVKLAKEGFIGKARLEEKRVPSRVRVGLKVTGRGIIREETEIVKDGVVIGISTSGTHLPYVDYPAAMALIDVRYSEPGTVVEANVRGRMIPAEVVALPFYRKKSEK